MAYFAIEGPRPSGTGHWRYYSDEAIAFGRLVFMHEFDPAMAPARGWGLMAEMTAPSEDPAAHPLALASRCELFTPANASVMERARGFLAANDVTPLGRYGRWEYSSMAQVMRDGFRFGREWADRLAVATPDAVAWRDSQPCSVPRSA
jgi:hypothetical protein